MEMGFGYRISGRHSAPDGHRVYQVIVVNPVSKRVPMTKSTLRYWNALAPENQAHWTPITGLEDMAEELTLSSDPQTGEYTRLTRFLPGADTSPFGGKTHTYPEEVFIVSGRLYDHAFAMWLEAGHYASRPPGELHGPFTTDVGCVVLEMSFPQRSDDAA